ncbi:MAG: sel1 repeat family protein [Aliidiomarina sp.]|uniref:tetratricopeptide repeat protein n=1 Tax=Aliidiomarina sp. TaxID=1872439 RepID=UPI0025C712C9|nr:tetratricopeptide repeat protein [Aliidiomarina sp.]MCH8502025.1 sel1 repeat family protein [Aliidiomarina sp.]
MFARFVMFTLLYCSPVLFMSNVANASSTNASEPLLENSEQLCSDGSCRPHIMMLHRQARWGDLQSAAIVAMLYITGDGVKQDIDYGVRLMTRAAKYNSPIAINALATWYRQGTYVEQDDEQADYYLQRGVDIGYAPAEYQMALRLYLENTSDSIAEANALLTKAARAGSAPAMFLLARLKLNGELIDYDLEGATALLQRLSMNGHQEARALSRQLVAELEREAKIAEQQVEVDPRLEELADALQGSLTMERIQIVGTNHWGRTESALSNVAFQRDAFFNRGGMFRIRSQECDFATNCATSRPESRHSSLFDVLSNP